MGFTVDVACDVHNMEKWEVSPGEQERAVAELTTSGKNGYSTSALAFIRHNKNRREASIAITRLLRRL
jgi:hypothetical protein